MSPIRQFWQVLMTPSDHAGDPYAEASNQLGHIALGCIFSLVACVIWFIIFGEMPYRAHVWVTVVFGYAILFEILIQGWEGRDSTIDTFFVACGSTMTLWPVREIGFSPDIVVIEFKPVLLGSLMLISAIALCLHLWPRIKRHFGNRTNA